MKKANMNEVTTEPTGTGMKLTIQMIRTRFPSVAQMKTEELDSLMKSIEAGNTNQALILLDVRSEQEFKVSCLPNAISINPNISDMALVLAQINSQVSNLEDKKTVVAYCSVGYRSSSLIQNLDTREPEEIQVSRLPNSIPVNPSLKDMSELLSVINKAKGGPEEQTTVVMYCAVGYRASILTQRLMKELAKPENKETRSNITACNLEGSIFKWANEGKDMVDGKEGKRTKMVHGVDRKWGKLLFPDIVSK
ncbi:uncharacterized protein LOC116289659 [Actinia tenebrosa]|uniref:Uncharacterized protein LOC116289659 n=1 Tax=Actinia tenebrosa TaxID=6105 RepID=A0A6P8HA64_ACTTE|nr:uncharacterized protein LOC116289659 [Actinia tenebrosa]